MSCELVRLDNGVAGPRIWIQTCTVVSKIKYLSNSALEYSFLSVTNMRIHRRMIEISKFKPDANYKWRSGTFIKRWRYAKSHSLKKKRNIGYASDRLHGPRTLHKAVLSYPFWVPGCVNTVRTIVFWKNWDNEINRNLSILGAIWCHTQSHVIYPLITL